MRESVEIDGRPGRLPVTSAAAIQGLRGVRGVRHATVFAASFAVLILRRPQVLTRAEFFNEDGQVFFVGSFFGSSLEQLARSYAGYLNVVPRIVAWIEHLVAVGFAPLVGNLIAVLIVAGIATYIASDRLQDVIPSARARLLLAAGLVVLPGSWETLGSMALIQWYMGIVMLLASIARAPTRPVARIGQLLGLAAAGLTGPFSVVFAPLYAIRAWRSKDRWSLAMLLVIVGCAAIQAFAYFLGDRGQGLPTPAGAAALLLARLWSTVIGDFWLGAAIQAQPPIGFVLIATTFLVLALGTVLRHTARDLRPVIAIVALVAVAAAMLGEAPSFPASPYLGARYFLIPTFLVVLCLAANAGRRRVSPFVRSQTLILTSLVTFGIVGDFALPARQPHDWAVRSQCIGGPDPCTVPVEFANAWSIHWPGSGGTYIQPKQSGTTP